MENEIKISSPIVRNSLCCWFNFDLINVEDVDELIGLSEVVITDLLRSGVKREDLVRMLQTVLETWGPEVIEEFEEITNVGWSDTPELEETLRAIVSNMLSSTSASYYTPPDK